MTEEQLATLTDSDFGQILEEFRNRGYACVAYGVAELGEGPLQDEDGNYNAEAVQEWFDDEERGSLEDAMCSAVWDYCQGVEMPKTESEEETTKQNYPNNAC